MKSKLTKVVSLAMVVAIIISMAMPFASAAKKVTNYGLCSSPVTGNADNASFPKSLGQVKAGKTYYLNFQVDSSQKWKWVRVYVAYNDLQPVWTKKYTAENYARYADFKYKVPAGRSGDILMYYFQVRYTNGTTKTFPSGGYRLVNVK